MPTTTKKVTFWEIVQPYLKKRDMAILSDPRTCKETIEAIKIKHNLK